MIFPVFIFAIASRLLRAGPPPDHAFLMRRQDREETLPLLLFLREEDVIQDRLSDDFRLRNSPGGFP